jgi:hypothetical protein
MVGIVRQGQGRAKREGYQRNDKQAEKDKSIAFAADFREIQITLRITDLNWAGWNFGVGLNAGQAHAAAISWAVLRPIIHISDWHKR